MKEVLANQESELRVVNDEPRKYYVVTKTLSWRGGPLFFGAVVWGKAYVSYHLMPLHVCPELTNKLSPELKRRMQGKSCFDFHDHDESLFDELAELTKSGLEHYREKNLL